MLQLYEPPAEGRPASWADTTTRYVELKPRRNSGETDPVAEYAVRHMRARMRKGRPQYRVKVRELRGRAVSQVFVVHLDGTRTAISD